MAKKLRATGEPSAWEVERGLEGPDGRPLRHLRGLAQRRSARRWIFHEGAMLGILGRGKTDVTWIPDAERESAFARLLELLDERRLDCDRYGGFDLYKHADRYAVIFEEEDWR